MTGLEVKSLRPTAPKYKYAWFPHGLEKWENINDFPVIFALINFPDFSSTCFHFPVFVWSFI